MNYNTVFAPTARVERFVKNHVQNLPTYGLVLAVIVLAGIGAALNFVTEQCDRVPEYEIRLRLYIIKAKRSAVRRAISAYSFISYNGIDKKVQRFAVAVRKAWANRVTIARATMDRIFCLG